jgi:hypothetical protein
MQQHMRGKACNNSQKGEACAVNGQLGMTEGGEGGASCCVPRYAQRRCPRQHPEEGVSVQTWPSCCMGHRLTVVVGMTGAAGITVPI